MTETLKAAACPQPLKGRITVPGDKSISHRALIMGALARGQTRISGLLMGEDVLATWRAVEQLGAEVELVDNEVQITGVGGQGLAAPENTLDMGNSGTAMRLLAGVLAGQAFDSELSGDESLNSRPMRRIITPLTLMGARITGTEEFTAPLHIRGQSLHGIEYTSPVASAQVKSCVLLAGLYAAGKTRVNEPGLSRDHTERMLHAFGAPLDHEGFVEGGTPLVGTTIAVPADISSAAFPLAAALLVPGSEVELPDVGINPSRDGFLKAVMAMGADVTIAAADEQPTEPRATLVVRYSGRLNAIDLDPALVPSMVDEIPVLMALAATARGTTRIRGAQELRVKECDRLEVMGTALSSMGVEVTLYEDGADITGRCDFDFASCDSHADHRIAMSLAVLGQVCEAGIEVNRAEFINTSFPGFADQMRNLGANLSMNETDHQSSVRGKVPVVTIDGPVGSGKGTISTRLAERLGWRFLDSGALYRLVALSAMNKNVDPEDTDALREVAENLDFGFRRGESEVIPLLEGEDVALRIRNEDVSAMASRVAAVPQVRSAMVERQRAFAKAPGLVADGRDMGTVIFPHAELKIFLTASVDVRARRRHKQLKDKGESVNLSRLFREIEARDERDMSRPIAPLKAADDAVVIDSTEFTIDEVLDRIQNLVKKKNLT